MDKRMTSRCRFQPCTSMRPADRSTIPAGKLGEGSDIAAACVYLASDQGGYVTGQTLHVNGGMAMI